MRRTLLTVLVLLAVPRASHSTYELEAVSLVPLTANDMTGGSYTLQATLGQSAAGSMTGGPWALRLGLWPIVLETTGILHGAPPPALYDFELGQNRPNPFNPTTRITYTIPGRSGGSAVPMTFTVYDLQGRVVREILNTILQPGTYAIDWDGTSASGSRVASGVYCYRLQAGGFTATKRFVVIK